jgi:concentrative nucleoside transporter, CNT family
LQFVHGLLGLAFFCGVSWLLSSHRKHMPWRVIVGGLGLQLLLAWLFLSTSVGHVVFGAAAKFVTKLISMAAPGAEMVFGVLAKPEVLSEQFGMENSFIFSFAGTGLVAIIFFSALMAVLYHLGVMQFLVWCLAKVMSWAMGVSGAESMSMAANVFVGQTEAPLVVKPYLAKMTNSELNALMTGGFATIAGSVLAVYMGFIGEEYGAHLLTASVMSAPAAFVVAKIMLPETEVAVTSGKVKLEVNRSAHNLIEAAANGTSDGLKLWLNVIAMLIAFIALVSLVNWPLEAFGGWLEMSEPLNLNWIFGRLFSPIAWLMGVEGGNDCRLFGSLLGTKVAVNEFVAFDQLHGMLPGENARAALDWTFGHLFSPVGWLVGVEGLADCRHFGSLLATNVPANELVEAAGLQKMVAGADGAKAVFEHSRSAAMAAYALCGFANFASIGIQMGGITPLAPERKTDISRLALRAMIGGAFASWMTATVAGIFL